MLLQRCGNQAIVGIASGVASLCERSLVLRLLYVEFSGAAAFGAHFPLPVFCFHGCLCRHRLDDTEKLLSDGIVDSRTAHAETSLEP